MIHGTKIFHVTIENGDLDPKAYNHYADFSYDNLGTQKNYEDKAKALYRWYMLSMNLQKGLETLSNITITGGDSKTVPTSVDFYLTYTQPDGLWVDCEESEEGAKEISNGRFILEGDKALTKIIKDTLSNEYKGIVSVFDPEPADAQKPADDTQLPRCEKTVEITLTSITNATITVESVIDGYRMFEDVEEL